MKTIENLTRRRRKIMALTARANNLIFREKPEAAVRKLQKAESLLDPSDHDIAAEMGVIYTVPLQRFEDGLRLLKPAADAGEPTAYVRLGNVYIFRGENEKAIEPLLKAVEVGEDVNLAYQFLGRAYFNLEKYPDAAKWYQKAADHEGDALFRFLALNCYFLDNDTGNDHDLPADVLERVNETSDACFAAAVGADGGAGSVHTLVLREALAKWEALPESNLRQRLPLKAVHHVLMAYFIYGTKQTMDQQAAKADAALASAIEICRYLLRHLPSQRDFRNVMISVCMESFVNASTYYMMNQKWAEWDEAIRELYDAAELIDGEYFVVDRYKSAAAVNQVMGTIAMAQLGIEGPNDFDELWERLAPQLQSYTDSLDFEETKSNPLLAFRRATCFATIIILGTCQPSFNRDVIDTMMNAVSELTSQIPYCPPQQQEELRAALGDGVAVVEQQRPDAKQQVLKRGGAWPR